jgi:hypothetical protein
MHTQIESRYGWDCAKKQRETRTQRGLSAI